MSGRLIVVSNRVPTGAPSGGLVVALHECLSARGGIWVGTSGELVDSPGTELRQMQADPYEIKVFDLTHDEHRDYYAGYANSVLWPLCHRRIDLLELSRQYYATYRAVNERLARMLAAHIQPDDRVWIHDYHFLPLAGCLRALGVTAKLGYFHHIPFPTETDLRALPEGEDLLDWLSDYDLVGLQTQGDVAAALDIYRRHTDGEQFLTGDVLFRGRLVALRSFPIGIDADRFASQAGHEDGRAMMRLRENEKLVIGVDRLDYSKGLPNRLQAFGAYLDRAAPDAPRTTLLQIAPPSRGDVEAYREIRAEMEHIAGHVNGLHAQIGWTPIQYLHRALSRDQIASLYRAADAALVTPLADGMNLVAKEFIAAQDPEDPGVLILSQFAGAAEQLSEAVIVNPHDIQALAQAVDTALNMPRSERVKRHAALRAAVFDKDIDHWTHCYLEALDRAGEPELKELEERVKSETGSTPLATAAG
ncbi:alpha,alpha-trehalose-phosphate synthase (UDP-forming) [Dinoroseobacter sp. S375]|uniref:alpha,alpha-trehalose-phosphate synthase (UDP-forming) n=1 Tax=Dinoroseobacter sp. S375 TaxID=3415136 RepID=UPI003C7E2FF4